MVIIRAKDAELWVHERVMLLQLLYNVSLLSLPLYDEIIAQPCHLVAVSQRLRIPHSLLCRCLSLHYVILKRRRHYFLFFRI